VFALASWATTRPWLSAREGDRVIAATSGRASRGKQVLDAEARAPQEGGDGAVEQKVVAHPLARGTQRAVTRPRRFEQRVLRSRRRRFEVSRKWA